MRSYVKRLATTVIPMYLTELAPLQLRGAMGVLCQLGINGGVVISQILGHRCILGKEATWHYLLGGFALPVLAASVFLPIMPESPRYLYIVRGQEKQAVRELSRLRCQPATILSAELLEMRKESRLQEQQMTDKWSVLSILKSSSLRLPLLLVCALQAGQQLNGINMVFYYSTAIFASTGMSEEESQYAGIGAGVINVITATLSVYLVTHCSRRRSVLTSITLTICCLLSLMISLIYLRSSAWMPYFSIMSLLAYVLFFGLGLGPIPFFIGAELFPQGPRPTAMSVGSMCNWLGNFAVGMTFPIIHYHISHYSFLVFIIISMLLFIFIYCYLPETREQNPTEVAELLSIQSEERITTSKSDISDKDMFITPSDINIAVTEVNTGLAASQATTV